MKTGPEIVEEFVTKNNIDMADFNEWFNDAGYSQDEANHLENYVEDVNVRKQHAVRPLPNKRSLHHGSNEAPGTSPAAG